MNSEACRNGRVHVLFVTSKTLHRGRSGG